MVDLSTVNESNESLKSSSSTSEPTALFVGATSGVGESTVKQLAKYTIRPTVFLVGRNETAASSIISELKSINPQGDFTFIKSDVSLIKNVDAVCDKVKQKTDRLDILFMSQGYQTFAGRNETSEGLEQLFSLRYYSRLRFAENLLPLLAKSKNSPRIVSVLAGGGREGKLDESDLELQKYSLLKAAYHSSTMTTLAFEALQKQYPNVGFVHAFPGIVKTNLFTSGFSAPVAFGMKWIVSPLLTPIATSVEECGQRQLFHATSSRYATGVYSLDWNGEQPPAPKVLTEYRERGLADTVWKHTTDWYQKITGKA